MHKVWDLESLPPKRQASKNLFILLKGDKTVSNYTLDEGPIDKRMTTTRPSG
jgi:hypothetical protein